ncbi:MAG: galactokinase [bacterium]|nr:MAG: galactokinase [bacterium]
MRIDFQKNLRNLDKLYGSDKGTLEIQIERYQRLVKKFLKIFKEPAQIFFSVPGRIEISGNHTDHNNGKVLAASINLDSIAVASKNDMQKVILYSEGYEDPFEINLDDLEICQEEAGTTMAIIRGIAKRFNEIGYKTGGFFACMTSDVLQGSGLSSSASVEVLIASIFNYLFNEAKIPPNTIAQIGQYAENVFFGKPCGLMDQMACAVGGIIAIDFKDPQNPQVEEIDFDFKRYEYDILIVDTGGSHADLTEDYASVPEEMKSVAKKFKKDVLREVDENVFLDKIAELRNSVGDRAVIRTMHYFDENRRVVEQIKMLDSGDFQKFLSLVQQSGDSSLKWLQNIYSVKNEHEQGVTLALALTAQYIAEIKEGACRVHGGGFAGTIQVFLPQRQVDDYIRRIEKIFGRKSVIKLKIRQPGIVTFNV